MNDRLKAWRAIDTNDDILKDDLSRKDGLLEERFKDNMEFGTAGIRGIMGAGTDRMNVHTIAAAASAYGQYLMKYVKSAKTKGIVIGHDNRYNSKLFTEVAAKAIMAHGVKVYLYENNDMQPTPFVSYSIRTLGLAGGAIITASHNPKEYNGFKVYDTLGGQLMPSETKKIQDIMKDIDPLTVKQSDKKTSTIKNTLVDAYVKDVLKLQIRKKDHKRIKVVFTPQHGTANKIGPKILQGMGVSYRTVESQMNEDPEFSNTRTPNPEDGRSLDAAIKLARKEKADIAITTDPDADRFGIAVKYKRRFKYLNGNQIAALYLNFMLKNMRVKNAIPKNAYIVTTNVSGSLTKKIAKRFGIKVYETHVGFKNIAQVIESKKDGQFLFAYEESYGFLLDKDLCRDKDAFQAITGVVEMANYYKSQNRDLFTVLKTLYKSYGIHRTSLTTRKLTDGQATRLMNRIKKLKTVLDKKVVNVDDYRTGNINGLSNTKLVKVELEDGSWFAIRPSGTEPKIKIYMQTVGTREQKLIDVVEYEKHIANIIRDNSESFDVKKFSWKTVIKYAIFVGIIVGIMFFVFNVIYETPVGDSAFDNGIKLFRSNDAWIWIMPWFGKILFNTINAFSRYRMIKYTGGYVKLKDLQIASLMGTIIAYITPFAIGGDAIVYWYLRRKGADRGPLISSLMTATSVYQLNTVLETIVLMTLGWPMYQYILFDNSAPEALAATIFFVAGLFWNIFSTVMILTLTMIKPFQEFIVRNSIRLLEWVSFIYIIDPGKTSSGYMYELRSMRRGMKKLWGNKRFMFEIMLWKIIPSLLSFGAIAILLNGWVNLDVMNDASVNPYIGQLVGNDIVKTANSFAITPGGSGTREWLSLTVRETIYSTTNGSVEFDSALVTATSFDVMWKMITGWPSLTISSILVMNILIGESKLQKWREEKKNLELSGSESTIPSFKFYNLSAIAWLLIMGSFFTFLAIFQIQ